MKNYYKLTMRVKASEAFDTAGKYIFTPETVRVAILHPAQEADQNKIAQIKTLMWENFKKECQWSYMDQNAFKNLVSFQKLPIPYKSAAITYHI